MISQPGVHDAVESHPACQAKVLCLRRLRQPIRQLDDRFLQHFLQRVRDIEMTRLLCLKAADMLSYYGERLGTVEINNTFYRMPTRRATSMPPTPYPSTPGLANSSVASIQVGGSSTRTIA